MGMGIGLGIGMWWRMTRRYFIANVIDLLE
jgi:hypothetical protein